MKTEHEKRCQHLVLCPAQRSSETRESFSPDESSPLFPICPHWRFCGTSKQAQIRGGPGPGGQGHVTAPSPFGAHEFFYSPWTGVGHVCAGIVCFVEEIPLPDITYVRGYFLLDP